MSNYRPENRIRGFIEYTLVIALYYVTGGAFSYRGYSTQITVFFLVTAAIALYSGTYRRLFAKRTFVPLASMSFFIMLVPALAGDSYSSYIAIIMQIFIGFFCASIFEPYEFCRKYVKVIIFFAAVSLGGFAIGMVAPSVAQRFPVIIGGEGASVDYYNAGIYVFMQPKGFGDFRLTTRNAGICWEPGCYQCFLNIALLMLMEEKKKGYVKHFYLKFAILIITVFTTFSTTGIIILGMILVVYVNEWRGIGKASSVLLPVFGVLTAVYVLAATASGQRIVQKITSEIITPSEEGQNFMSRLSFGHIKYLFEGGFWFFGMTFTKLLSLGGKGIWNAVIHSFLCLGTPFTLIQMTGYRRGSRVLVEKGWLLFVIMIMCSSTETLYWRVFFNTIAACGWMYQQNELKRY